MSTLYWDIWYAPAMGIFGGTITVCRVTGHKNNPSWETITTLETLGL